MPKCLNQDPRLVILTPNGLKDNCQDHPFHVLMKRVVYLQLVELKTAIKALWTKDIKLIQRYFKPKQDGLYISIDNPSMTCKILKSNSGKVVSVIICSRIPIE